VVSAFGGEAFAACAERASRGPNPPTATAAALNTATAAALNTISHLFMSAPSVDCQEERCTNAVRHQRQALGKQSQHIRADLRGPSLSSLGKRLRPSPVKSALKLRTDGRS
jgi:hypothetical protein